MKRINYTGDLAPSFEVLSALQKNHLLNVPFENLDIDNGIPIKLDTDLIRTKIVTNKRGGFCYELNGLFCELLSSLGFKAKRISGRVWDKTNGYGAEYDHLAILVEIDGQLYLSDVGFGEFTFAPLKVETNTVQADERGDFLIDTCKVDGQEYFRVSKIDNGLKTPEYIFSLTERALNEFSTMCQYHQTSSKSHFTIKRIVSIPTIDGRVTITGDLLKIKKADKIIKEYNLQNEEIFKRDLKDYFHIDLSY
ncbi:MAG: arylamine N-acetyltransferase [Flavobacteriaceae bacterium]